MAGCHDLIVLLPLVLDHQFDLILEAEQEENGFFPRHPRHLHIVDLKGGKFHHVIHSSSMFQLGSCDRL